MNNKKLLIFYIFIQLVTSCSSLSDRGLSILMEQSINPSNSRKALLFLTERSFNRPEFYSVKVVDKKYELHMHDEGNVIIFETSNKAVWNSETSVHLKWLPKDSLVIDYDKNLNCKLLSNNVEGTNITYIAR